MESLKEHAAVIIGTLTFLNVAGYSWIAKTIFSKLDKHDAKLDAMAEAHHRCQKELPERFVQSKDMDMVFRKLDAINDKLNVLPLVYRTKEEAAKDWRFLESRLAEIQESIKTISDNQQTSATQLWDKLNRVVDEFRANRTMIMDKQAQIDLRLDNHSAGNNK